MRALLDINVLIALHDRDHVHHSLASTWFQENIHHGWASCPLTQNGCVRIMAQPSYNQPFPVPALLAMLAASTHTPHHRFWADNISLLDTSKFNHGLMQSPKQLTDLYLLALAVSHGGRLVTFDRQFVRAAVPAAKTTQLVVLG